MNSVPPLEESKRTAFREALQVGAGLLALRLDAAVVAAFERHYAELLAGNQRANLTAIVAPVEAAEKHYLDSALCAEHVAGDARTLVDVGSGAGLPGIVCKLLRPGLVVTLLDSQRKRTEFLRHVSASLGLADLTVVQERAEDAGRDPVYRERFDCAVARAVAPLNVLVELALPFVRGGGRFVAMKGGEGEAEATAAERAIAVLGGRVREVVARVLPRGERRSLVLIEKVSATPVQFPRKAGMPAKRPLG